MATAVIEKSAKNLVTAEELWELSEHDKKFELIKGKPVEMTPPGGLHGYLAIKLGTRLQNFVEAQHKGVVMVESGYRLTTNPDTVRSPDVSFLSSEKIPAEGIPEGYISGAPDLAIEIVSPNDKASDIQEKVQDYLSCGTQLVWVVYPQQQLVSVFYPDGTGKMLHDSETLTGEAVVPGFACKVEEIFS